MNQIDNKTTDNEDVKNMPRKKKKVLKILMKIFGVLIVMAVIAYFYLDYTLGKEYEALTKNVLKRYDERKKRVEDINKFPNAIAELEKSFVFLNENETHFLFKSHLSWNDLKNEYEKLYEDNKKAIEKAKLALAIETGENAKLTFNLNINTSSSDSLKHLFVVRLLILDSLIMENDGNHTGAVKQLLDIVHISRLMANEGNLLEYFISMGCEIKTLESLYGVVQRNNFTEDFINDICDFLDKENSSHYLMKNVLQNEQNMAQILVIMACVGNESDNIEELTKESLWVTQKWMAINGLKDNTSGWSILIDYVEGKPDAEKKYNEYENKMKKGEMSLLANLMMPAINISLLKKTPPIAQAIIMLNIEKYKVKNGQYPDNLEQLVANDKELEKLVSESKVKYELNDGEFSLYFVNKEKDDGREHITPWTNPEYENDDLSEEESVDELDDEDLYSESDDEYSDEEIEKDLEELGEDAETEKDEGDEKNE